tara:strand:- start:207 stop:410 length:204 start_codon:yes stop_codon:yes gene_type:complete
LALVVQVEQMVLKNKVLTVLIQYFQLSHQLVAVAAVQLLLVKQVEMVVQVEVHQVLLQVQVQVIHLL